MLWKKHYFHVVTNIFIGEEEGLNPQTLNLNMTLVSNNVLRTRHAVKMVVLCPLLATEHINHSNKGRAIK